MPRALPTVAALAAVAAVVLGAGATPAAAQDTGRRQIRLTMSAEKVLPLLNTAVVRVRTPGTAQAGADGGAPAAPRDGASPAAGGGKTTHLTGIRISDDLAIVLVPDVDPAPSSYDVALYDGWLPAAIEAKDDSGLYALLRVPGRREPAPALTAAPIAPGFVVGAVSVGPTPDRPGKLEISFPWLEPGETINLPPGATVWAEDGRFAGLSSAVDGGTIIIPGADVLANAEELRAKVKPAAR